ncbi:flagellar hook-basal body protein [Gelria sp. Kuro-4]|uniref:flagellar hook-basal body protein n=1 Tax=Gelria sp. Kuro-4 TaxID=2796927 RepID=UPI001BEEE6BD|nr:flagellar hook-basal body protein [Gelria sp. Kuro-4]BCV24128.1 flagellar basal body rod protein FlgG [Gelria sp. Kuro-4]
MLRGLYSSAAGMVAQQVRLDVLANNLANAATAGYRADTAVTAALPDLFLYRFNDALAAFPGAPAGGPAPVGFLGTGAAVAQVATLQRPGPYRETGNPHDFALRGPGYFVVNTPQGLRYTRNGAFEVNQNGELVTGEGDPVLTRAGAVARADDPNLAANLAVVDAPPGVVLTKVGDSLYAAPQALPPAAAPVVQGGLEGANVEPVEAMVELISAMRTYEAGQKAIQTQDQTLDKLLNEVAKV